MSSSSLNTYVDKLNVTVDCKQGAVRNVRFNSDGEYCISCGSDKTLKLWNPYRQLHLKTYSGHGYEVLDAHSACDNATLCSGGMDKSVILWDVATGQVKRKYRGHAGTVSCVKFNEESTVILSGSVDGTIFCWDCRSRKSEPIQKLKEAKDSITSLQVSDHEILSGSADSYIRRYDLRIGRLTCDYVGKTITCVTFTKDSQCVLASSLDGLLRLFDKQTGELLNEYSGHRNSEYKIDSCLNNTDNLILSGSEDGIVYIWDLISAETKAKLEHPDQRPVHSLSHHPSDAVLLTASGSKMYMWASRYRNTDD
ncbi:WD repeat domain-containing protein 83 [Octopus sinensis]|uniref:WD repeat domain-containing protein 83 n=1 Tax=Octopus sinensis TaxID=2607531 RepID=A0A6P7TVW4_9MOLL|nr:WD repeat domain-containing protein 83 [Octopus sinensis]